MIAFLDNYRPASELEELRAEVAYLRKRSEQLAASLVRADTQAAAIRHELEQKRRGFTLMGELAVTLGQDTDYASAFHSISRRINGALNMQRTVVLTPTDDGHYRASVLQGYEGDEREAIAARQLVLPAEMLDPLRPLLITRADPEDHLATVRQALALPYLISTPVVLHGAIVAVLVTGRVREQRPFLPRLGRSDVETVQAVSAYLAAVLAGQRLQEAQNLANFDPLTSLPNQRLTIDRLQQAVALAVRDRFRCAVMFVDLDGFKAINDTLGHAAGDEVLRQIAQRLTHCVRSSDTAGRIGGDEFIVVLSHVDTAEDAGRVAAKLIAAVREPIDVYGTPCQVGASVGIAVYPDHGADADTLLARADEAMYAVKKNGKNAHGFAAL
jgi:diguanylate cyclase (GGDEF)-like protein